MLKQTTISMSWSTGHKRSIYSASTTPDKADRACQCCLNSGESHKKIKTLAQPTKTPVPFLLACHWQDLVIQHIPLHHNERIAIHPQQIYNWKDPQVVNKQQRWLLQTYSGTETIPKQRTESFRPLNSGEHNHGTSGWPDLYWFVGGS